MNTDKHRSLSEIAAALRDGSLSAGSLTETALTAHAAHAEALGAYKHVDAVKTHAMASAADAAFAAGVDTGPLQGIPVSAKDLYVVKGFPTFAGTPSAVPEDWSGEGPVIEAVRGQLGVITGKTHTVEIAFGGIGTNPHWGTPRNPWDGDAHRVPGGSSSGAGVSLNEGSALVALGTDTAGSIRIPASMTGMAGMKNTHTRWPIDGIFPLSPSLDTPGVLARSVADVAFAFTALDPRITRGTPVASVRSRGSVGGLRVGVPEKFFWDDCSPGVAEGARAALADLEKAGATLIPFELEETAEAYSYFIKGGLAAAEAFAFLNDELPGVLKTLDPAVQQRMAEGETLPTAEYLHRVRRLVVLSRAAAARMADAVDVIAHPTVPITPPTLDEVSTVEGYRPRNLMALRNTCIANLLTCCAITMPVALDDAGMPVGLQFMAGPFEEAALLSAALAAEAVLGTGRERFGVAPMVA